MEHRIAEWRPAPWYLTAVQGVHTAVGVIGVLAGAAMLGGGVLGLITTPSDWALITLITCAGALVFALGVLFTASGESIRKRRRRGLSFCCGVLLFFTGPMFVLGLASMVVLTRQRVLSYYESDEPAPAFPVLPARTSFERTTG